MNPAHVSNVEAVFSPGGSEEVLMALVGGAEKSVDVMMYVFSYSPLKAALIDAANRGVVVRVILDRQIETNLLTAQDLALSGVDVRWASVEYASTHAKLLIADAKTVFVGSQNWSRHAMVLNREAGALIRDVKTALDYAAVFESDWRKAKPWKP